MARSNLDAAWRGLQAPPAALRGFWCLELTWAAMLQLWRVRYPLSHEPWHYSALAHVKLQMQYSAGSAVASRFAAHITASASRKSFLSNPQQAGATAPASHVGGKPVPSMAHCATAG